MQGSVVGVIDHIRRAAIDWNGSDPVRSLAEAGDEPLVVSAA
jgi:hypothetical protein